MRLFSVSLTLSVRLLKGLGTSWQKQFQVQEGLNMREIIAECGHAARNVGDL